MAAPIVFFDIAGEDEAGLKTFYEGCFDWTFSGTDRTDLDVVPGFGCAIRHDPAEKRIYIGVDDINHSLSLIEQYGGMIEKDRFEVSGLVVLGLFEDPAGNKMGLIELDNGSIKIP